MERVLQICHEHPQTRIGGAQVAAYALHESLALFGIESMFVGADTQHRPKAPGYKEQALGAHDLLLCDLYEDEIRFATGQPEWRHGELPRGNGPWLPRILQEFEPDLVHIHHLVKFGPQILSQLAAHRLQRAKPLAIVMTLHDLYVTCPVSIMLRRDPRHHGQLCTGPGAQKCADCIPRATPEMIRARQAGLASALRHVDLCISPSHFNARMNRAMVGEIPARVIPNLLARENRSLQLPAAPNSPHRFGYFGRAHADKGIDVLLEAFAAMETPAELQLHCDIPPDYGAKIARAQAAAAGDLRICGSYENRQIYEKMAMVDTIVLPSTAYETAPVVIQEARHAARPVICSDTSGMAEAVDHGRDGMQFRCGDPAALAAAMTEMAAAPQRWQARAQRSAARRIRNSAVIRAHLAAYRDGMAGAANRR